MFVQQDGICSILIERDQCIPSLSSYNWIHLIRCIQVQNSFIHSKIFLSYVAPKRSTDLLATKVRPTLHYILVLLLELFIIPGCKSPLIMVQRRTNFCSQQISASFWCNIGQNFLECAFRMWMHFWNRSCLHFKYCYDLEFLNCYIVYVMKVVWIKQSLLHLLESLWN